MLNKTSITSANTLIFNAMTTEYKTACILGRLGPIFLTLSGAVGEITQILLPFVLLCLI